MLFNKRFKKYEDLLEYEAIERGRAKGKEEGRQEGRQEGARLMLRDVLQAMTADLKEELPPDLDEKISAADVDQLRSWMKLLLTGARPRQVFTAA